MTFLNLRKFPTLLGAVFLAAATNYAAANDKVVSHDHDPLARDMGNYIADQIRAQGGPALSADEKVGLIRGVVKRFALAVDNNSCRDSSLHMTPLGYEVRMAIDICKVNGVLKVGKNGLRAYQPD